MMIPIVMEPEMRNASGWKGQLGMVMGGLLYIDMCNPAQLEAKVDELYNAVVAKVKTPLLALLEKQRLALSTPLLSSSSAPAIASVAPSSPVAAGTGVVVSEVLLDQQAKCEDAMLQWLLANTPGRLADCSILFYRHRLPCPILSCKTSIVRQKQFRSPFSFPSFLSTPLPPPGIHASSSLAYTKGFYAAKMTTMDRLAKRVGKEPGFLLSLEVDEDDADDIIQVRWLRLSSQHATNRHTFSIVFALSPFVFSLNAHSEHPRLIYPRNIPFFTSPGHANLSSSFPLSKQCVLYYSLLL